jgi:hypothetical protein
MYKLPSLRPTHTNASSVLLMELEQTEPDSTLSDNNSEYDLPSGLRRHYLPEDPADIKPEPVSVQEVAIRTKIPNPRELILIQCIPLLLTPR